MLSVLLLELQICIRCADVSQQINPLNRESYETDQLPNVKLNQHINKHKPSVLTSRRACENNGYRAGLHLAFGPGEMLSFLGQSGRQAGRTSTPAQHMLYTELGGCVYDHIFSPESTGCRIREMLVLAMKGIWVCYRVVVESRGRYS